MSAGFRISKNVSPTFQYGGIESAIQCAGGVSDGPSMTGTFNQINATYTAASGTTVFSLADGIYIGSDYSGVTPPTKGAAISGQVTIGVGSADADAQLTVASTGEPIGINVTGQYTVTGGNNYGILVDRTYAYALGSNDLTIGVGVNPTFNVAAGTHTGTVAGIYSAPILTGNASTISTVYNIFADAGSSNAGTINIAYSGYFKRPLYANLNNVSLYADELVVGYPGVTGPRNGVACSGSVAIGTGTINPWAMLQVASVTGGFLPPKMSAAQRDTITPSSTPGAAGLIIHNTTTNIPQYYTGTGWLTFTAS